MCSHGVVLSKSTIKTHPSKKPIDVGINAKFPHEVESSSDGIMSDHMHEAIITPDEKPKIIEFNLFEMSFLKKKTRLAPSDVIKNIKNMPSIMYAIKFSPLV